ncbi:somatostatin receptor type 2-like [Haliotis rubra]|uniref:somatostatin receptor type 2-like n=1 Tax=Haliotis rubra TaxID=36100 RepID=UPI001EE56ED0|nr:somatostatin receptor type 2-like [Haliotis rubra]XP_046582874.1 somatostatin receptor type 2-like [Haliotis rubra]
METFTANMSVIVINMNHSNCSDTSADIMSVVESVTVLINLVLCVIICAGNTLTIVAVWKTLSLRTVPNMYVVSLAVADLLAGVMSLYQCVKYLPKMQKIFDCYKFMCLTRHMLLVTSLAASVLTMVVLAIDRLVYIKFCLHYDRMMTPRRALMNLGAAWGVAILVGTVSLYHNSWETATQCTMFEVFTVYLQLYTLVPAYIVCCIVIACCYCYIGFICYRHRRDIIRQEQLTAPDIAHTSSRLRQGWQLIQLFMMVYGTFILCWTPCMVALALGYTIGINTDVMNFLVPLAVANCGMNFFIYAFKNSDFRSAFKNILCGKRRKADGY